MPPTMPPTMQPTRLILCRHGESEGNRDKRFGGHGPAGLTERGRAQAQATGARLQRRGADILYSSDLPRASQTADLIGQQLALAPQLTAALRERSVGIFTGLSFDEARERHPDEYSVLLQRDPSAAPADGESYLQCQARVATFLDQALSEHTGQSIIVVSHHLALHLAVMHILSLPLTAAGPNVYIQIHNCALHRFEHYEDGNWQLLALNDTNHLRGLL
jgi:broad specificity phosphatase PhoE